MGAQQVEQRSVALAEVAAIAVHRDPDRHRAGQAEGDLVLGADPPVELAGGSIAIPFSISPAGGGDNVYHAINDKGQVVGAGFQNCTCPGALTFKPYLVTPPALLSVADTTVKQPTSGTATAHFTVSLSTSSLDPVSVDYETVDGSGVTGATSPTDYIHKEGTLNSRRATPKRRSR